MTTTAAPSGNPSAASLWLRLAALAAPIPAAWAVAHFHVLERLGLRHVALCAFQRVTGRPCPGCGMTRSILCLSQGDVVGSLRMHPLGVVLAAMLALSLVGTGVALARGGDPVARFLERRGMTFVIALIAAFLVQWVVRAFLVPEWAPDALDPR